MTKTTSVESDIEIKLDTKGRRVIKKYPNRRLYDTDTSSYVTVTQVKELVISGQPVMVIDVKSGEDLTRSVLLQIILDEEAGGSPMFSEELLMSIIRFYGNTMQSFMGPYLEKNIQTFLEMQKTFTASSHGVTPEVWTSMMNLQTPLSQGMMGTYAEQAKNLFVQMQETMAKQTNDVFEALRKNTKT